MKTCCRMPHTGDWPEIRLDQPCRTRDHGYPVLERRAVRDRTWVIADRGAGSVHRYVVWELLPDGSCLHGDYVHRLVDARACLASRSGQSAPASRPPGSPGGALHDTMS